MWFKLRRAAILTAALVAAVCVLCACPARSEERPARAGLAEGLLVTGMFEAVVAFNSGLAALSPELGGAVIMISAPIGMAESSNITAGVLMFALGLYDAFAVPREDMSTGEIFWTNFAAWHVIALASLPEYYLRHDEPAPSRLAFGPALVGGAPGLAVNFRF